MSTENTTRTKIMLLQILLSCTLAVLAHGTNDIDYINSLGASWTAGKNFEDGFEPALGLAPGYRPLPPSDDMIYDTAEDIPESFDPREQWPDCYTVKEIRNQGCCGSCWAFSASEVISDRICIASKNKEQVEVSAEDVLTCGGAGTCQGGWPSSVFSYYIKSGVVSGGLYQSKKGCQPYVITGDHPCASYVPTPKCQKSCIEGYNRTYTQDKHFGSKSYGVRVSDVQRELMTNGPVSATFSVYEDFFAYKTGVYHHLTGAVKGGHAVKLMGWGVENGVNYWLVANSWGEVFGEKGYFKIKRGNNECGFEVILSSILTVNLAHGSNNVIDYVNSLDTTWKAGKNFADDYRPGLGLLSGYKPRAPSSDIIYDTNEDIPQSFDPRQQWPDCYTVKEIRDQGCCGSCWAFAASEVISDRICIASKSKQQVEVSAQDVLTCSNTGDCGGGAPNFVYDYYIKSGVITGGLVDSHNGCQPYTITGRHPCKEYVDTPKCNRTCIEGYNRTYTQDKHFGSKQYGVSVKDAQRELMTNGPISAGMLVYSDFYNYKSGVYQHVTGDVEGAHVVKLMGWGVENDVDYWLVANSWGTVFGEQGYFKIIRGTNECLFENGGFETVASLR
ncbi:unnamed protein product [Oppiella nova]|uniref:Peptidase C1A papain C-terminal domain-containing protein n=1 Tax=Oppiella nova TaxID=334625 RepID=A0A7R9QH88_9ACAR|nr:unnamed protein product [Oppiella nova]CAG2165316.1 unnamed protein product [Oppiella nova]